MTELKLLDLNVKCSNQLMHDEKCTHCGKNPLGTCTLGYWTDSIEYGKEYDCDSPLAGLMCEDCPFLWCKDCKENLICELRGEQ